MALETNLNQNPYYDDWETVAKDKNYHRVLFKPGLAVQTRELTQLQSMLQNQIGRFGDNVFKEGTIVTGANFQYDANVAYVKLRDQDSGGNTVSVTTFANGVVEGITSGVRARVVAVSAGSEASAPNYNTLLVKYLNSGSNNTSKTFALNERIVFKPADGGNGEEANTIASDAFGFGSIFNVDEGIVFSKENFVQVAPQTLILEKYSTAPSYKVGFKIVESTVDSNEDSTLLSNATGSYNESAPGADRLKLVPTLVKRALTDTANTEQLTPIFEVENGNIKRVQRTSVYDDLGREMAKRTFEESGNYMLRQINVGVKEHLNTGSNFGRYSSSGTPAGDKDKLAIAIEPGIAYIMGYRNEVLTTDYIETDKATTTAEETGVNVSTNYGNYVIVNELAGPWDPTTYQTVSIRDTAANAVSTGNLGGGAGPGSEIGTAKLRFLQYRSGTMGDNAATYRLYLFDINITASGFSFSDARSFYINNGSGSDCFADAVLESGEAVLKEPSFNRVLFKSGVTATQQLTNNTGTVNTSYQFRDKITLSFNTSGTATLSLGGPHAGGTEELPYGTGSLNSTQRRDFLLSVDTTVTTTNNNGVATFTSGSNNIVGNSSSTFSADYKVGDFIQFANSSGSTSNTLRITNITGASSMVVTPAPTIQSGPDATHTKVFPAGYMLDMGANGTNGSRTITVGSSTSATFNIQENLTSTLSATTFFNNKREGASPSQKLVRKNRYVKLDLNTNAAGTTGPWNLGVADVFNIRNVYIGTTYSTTNRNVTSDFNLIVNSNDNIYNHSKIELKENSAITLSSSQKLLIEFDYFEHSFSTGIGFFSVDSYPIDPNESTSNTTAITTPQIPRYSSTSSGTTYDLRDTIDFRPRVTTTMTDSTTVSGATENPSVSTTLDVDADGSYVPVADENFEADVLYYLPRVDRVVMGKDGKRKVIKGNPASSPVAPVEPAEVMTLALLNIPPFPSLSLENAFNFNRVDLAVKVNPFFHKRYRMSDIASLEKRIDRLEYYTALNVLEKSARDLTIPDGSGLNRFKNGIFVDSFFGHNNANLLDPSYNASVDSAKGELRPKFEQQNIQTLYNASSSSNVTRRGKQVRLDLSSNNISISPNDILYVGSSLGSATAAGTVKYAFANSSLTRVYLHNSNGTFAVSSTLKKSGSASTDTISAVQTPNDGALVTLPYTHEIYVEQPYASRVINPVGELLFNWVGEVKLFPEADHWVDTTTQPDVQWDLDLASNWQSAQNAWGTQWNEWNTTSSSSSESREVFGFVDPGDNGTAALGTRHNAIDEVITTTTEQQTRSGTRLNVQPYSRTQTSGPFLTRTDIVPYMRSREIKFAATGMKPNTRVYPFFDDIAVSSYVAPTTSSFANTGALGSSLVTNANGAVYGVFTLPNDDSLKFRLGERPFKLIDISNLTTEIGTATTSAEAPYTALGLASSQKGITFTTREARVTSETVQESRTVTTSSASLQPHRGDPVAQTFYVGDFEIGNLNILDNKFGAGADGVFISAIDLFFSRKSATNGIAVELREVVNGTITAVRVPFGFKRINVDDVNVSVDGSIPTTFYFDEPVYLRGDKEYAFVVKPDGDDPDYRLWIAQLGETDTVTGQLIDQQPGAGVLFTSANDRTYTPRQNQDICFVLWRANFQKALTGTAIFENEPDEFLRIAQISPTRFSIGEKVRGESLLRVYSNTDSFTLGDTVTFGANTGQIRKIITVGGNYILKTDMKGSVSSGANVVFGGTSTYYATVNTFTANTGTGFVEYFNRGFGQLTVNSSSGAFTSNTTLNDGFYRGQVSNAYAQVFDVRDIKFNVLSPRYTQGEYLDTAISWAAKTTSNAYSIAGSFTNITNFENNDFTDAEKIVAGKTAEDNNTSGNKTLTVQATLTSNSNRLSPVIDVGRATSVITIHNIVNNDNTDEVGNYGNANARYITKKITLADGQEAEDLKIYLSAYKPAATEVDVYARFQNAADGDDFRDKAYTKLNQITPANTISSTVNRNDFVELEYGVPSTNATATSAFLNSANSNVLRYYNSANSYFDTYKYYSVKIVLRSTGSQIVPRIKDLRTIALQS